MCFSDRMNYLFLGLLILAFLVCAFAARGRTADKIPEPSPSDNRPAQAHFGCEFLGVL
jgi:hypothetical protein